MDDEPMHDNGAAERIAQVEAEWAQQKALDREVDDAIRARVQARKGNSSSMVFTVRLDRGEIAALTRRAEAIAELEDAVAKVRAHVP